MNFDEFILQTMASNAIENVVQDNCKGHNKVASQRIYHQEQKSRPTTPPSSRQCRWNSNNKDSMPPARPSQNQLVAHANRINLRW